MPARSAAAATSEAEIHAAADQLLVELDVGVGPEPAGGSAAQCAEIDMQVLDLGAEIADERELDAGTSRPAGIGVARSPDPETRHRSLDVADRETARHVRQNAIERVAGA